VKKEFHFPLYLPKTTSLKRPEKLLETWEELPVSFVTSSVTNAGREELLAYIDQVNEALANAEDFEEE
jgi:hypothetical protein